MHIAANMFFEQFSASQTGKEVCKQISSRLIVGFFIVAIAGCASLPNPNIDAQEEALAGKVPQIVGPRGVLTTSQSKAILAKVDAQAGRTDILQHHVIYEEKMVGSPLSKGNKVTLLRDGPSTYAAMFKAIQGDNL